MIRTLISIITHTNDIQMEKNTIKTYGSCMTTYDYTKNKNAFFYILSKAKPL